MGRRKSPLEDLAINTEFWRERSVFLTGHTGFKGGWIAHWLVHLGARVHGFSLAPSTTPNFYTETKLSALLETSKIGDIRNFSAVKSAMELAKPSIVIHMAAQPIVRESYITPVETFSTNVMGTLNILEVVRQLGSVEAVINITSDKCYENLEHNRSFNESDCLGGHDPYSSSKACAEILTASYRKSFFTSDGIRLASARAGNCIGGGDWTADRLLPDFFRALEDKSTLLVRSPDAVRPWQHVLEPISGYLTLAENLVNKGCKFDGAWNFGPDERDTKSVAWIVEYLSKKISGASWEFQNVDYLHEANILRINCSKAKSQLNWRPRWDIKSSVDKTIEWYKGWKNNLDLQAITVSQIKEYSKKLDK